MYSAAQTYWLEPSDILARGLRRYSSRGIQAQFLCEGGYHDALTYTDRVPAVFTATDPDGRQSLESPQPIDHSDPRWPTECRHGCGYRFAESDHWQMWAELIYRRTDTGQEYVLHTDAGADTLGAPSAPPGASWNAWWMSYDIGSDGICLMVRLPNNHDWMVDSEASNCTRKGEPHQCWVRHGDPREAKISVDKNGDTCAAGAGSIQVGDYHGFLQAGVLTAG